MRPLTTYKRYHTVLPTCLRYYVLTSLVKSLPAEQSGYLSPLTQPLRERTLLGTILSHLEKVISENNECAISVPDIRVSGICGYHELPTYK